MSAVVARYPSFVFQTTEVQEHDSWEGIEYARYEPALVRGAARGWPASGAIAGRRAHDIVLTLLGSATGQLPYDIMPPGPDPLIGYERGQDDGGSIFGAREHLYDALLRCYWRPKIHGVCYANSVSIEHLGGFAQQLGTYDFRLPYVRAIGPKIWLGSGGHRTALHFDGNWNVATVLAGTKRFLLIPPTQTSYDQLKLRPLDQTIKGAPCCQVDPLVVANSSAFAALSPQVATLEPGDALVVPPYWWHHVESRGLNVMVNAWYDELPYGDAHMREASAAVTLAWTLRQSGAEDIADAERAQREDLEQWIRSQPLPSPQQAYHSRVIADFISYCVRPDAFGGGSALADYITRLRRGRNARRPPLSPFAPAQQLIRREVPECEGIELDEDDFVSALTGNVADGSGLGLYIEQMPPSPVGESLQLSIMRGDVEILSIPATVYWCNANGVGLQPGMGVVFSEEGTRKVAEYLGV